MILLFLQCRIIWYLRPMCLDHLLVTMSFCHKNGPCLSMCMYLCGHVQNHPESSGTQNRPSTRPKLQYRMHSMKNTSVVSASPRTYNGMWVGLSTTCQEVRHKLTERYVWKGSIDVHIWCTLFILALVLLALIPSADCYQNWILELCHFSRI